jgi:tyrosyl-tRNA synthetase
VNIHFFLDWKEYFSAQEFFRQSRYNIVPEKVIGGVLMTLSSLWFFLDDLNFSAVIGLVSGIAIVFGSPYFRRWASKRKWAREPLYHSEHTVSFSEEGVHFLMGHVESNLNWRYYQRMLESPDGFLLIYGNDSFNLFPKRAFAGEEMINNFRKLAGKKLKNSRQSTDGGDNHKSRLPMADDTGNMIFNEQLSYLTKGTVDVIPLEELKSKLERAAASGRKLRVKAGFDPTAPDLHVGHTVLIRKMRHFQQLGHDVIFLIGDFTGLIGDPTGRNMTRPPLTREQINANAETYKAQIFKLLDPEKTIIEFNAKWMNAFTPEDFIRLTAKVTVAQLMEREEFARRFSTGVPISLHELLYPIVQGYDSVALKADVELGGTDQKFNLLMAREIQRAYGLEPQVIMTTPLLEGLDGGSKMSKSLNNYIGITESPDEIYGKAMSISDDLMWRYYELLTDLSPVEVARLKTDVESGKRHPRDVKSELAKKLVADFHSQAQADRAEAEFIRRFREHQTPDNVEIRAIKSGSQKLKLVDLIAQTGLAPSKTEARRLISQGGVKLNGERIGEVLYEIDTSAVKEAQLQVGKLKYLKVIFE